MKLIGIFVLLLMLPLATASLQISEQAYTPVIIAGAESSAPLMLRITNSDASSSEFEIYSLVGVKLTPPKLTLSSGTQLIEITATPSAQLIRSTNGFLIFQYELYNNKAGRTIDQRIIKIVDLKDVFAINPVSIKPGDTTTSLVLTNIENRTVENLQIIIESPFIEHKETLTLTPYEQKTITVPLESSELARQVAGRYIAEAHFEYKNTKATREWEIRYLESSGLSVDEATDGVIIRQYNTIKTNEGSVPITAAISYRRDLLSRLFTTLSPEPAQVTKQGLGVTYLWTKELAPAESLAVTMTTNYTFPFIALIIVLAAAALVWLAFWKPLVVSKRVHFVRTKGGEFALKVTLSLKSHNSLHNVALHDHIPQTMQLYHQFGIKPHTIDEGARRLTWQLGHLNAGETRVFSYVVYSKMRVLGNFHLPLASATCTVNGKPLHVSSNQTAFVSETITKE